jgi:hypothetical protein
MGYDYFQGMHSQQMPLPPPPQAPASNAVKLKVSTAKSSFDQYGSSIASGRLTTRAEFYGGDKRTLVATSTVAQRFLVKIILILLEIVRIVQLSIARY